MKAERIFLIIAGLVLVALLMHKYVPATPAVASSQDASGEYITGMSDIASAQSPGPAYLSYAQNWMFGPPVQPFLPSQVSGSAVENQAGGAVTVTGSSNDAAPSNTCNGC